MKRYLAMLLCLVLLLTGCGDPAVYTPTGDGLSYDDDYTGATHAPEEEPQDQALSLSYYPGETMNPIQCTDFTNRAFLSLIYQSLFIVDRDYHIEPVLCKQYSMAEDMRSYTFYLESATFSDGSLLTAQDVVATLNSAKSSTYYSGRFLHITDISLSGDGGITVKLDTPCENLPILLDIPIIKESQLEAEHPLGTGPYVLTGIGSELLLHRRTDWWCRADMAATANTIALRPAQSPAQIRDDFQFADLSMVYADPGSDEYVDYRCDYELWDCENGIFVYLAFSAISPVFLNADLRAAVTYAIDRDLLAENYYRGFARSASLPASPLSPYYSAAMAEKYALDAQRFAQAVTDAQLPPETQVRLLVNSDDTLRLRVARAIADMLTQGGLPTQVLEKSGNDYTYALQTKDFDLYLGQTRLSPNMDLSAFFSSSGALSVGGVSNVSAYALCQQALENHGNYYTLYQTVMDNGLLCPVAIRSYAVYATRGLITDLTPARDNVFYYSLGKTMEDAYIR